MYRPEGWKNNSYDCSVCDTEPEGCPGCGISAYEAGADAYEEGLKKEGIAVEVDKSGSIAHFHYRGSDRGMVGYDMAEKLPTGSKGYLVFIPEEEK